MAASTRSSNQDFIVSFYDPSDPSSRQEDSQGRTLDDILAFSDGQLEHHHDFIQFLFPLPERSPFNPGAPVITKPVREAFLSRRDLRDELRRSLVRMLRFYGFDASRSNVDSSATAAGQNQASTTSSGNEELTIRKLSQESAFLSAASETWMTTFDHNHLRITRILRCLRILGLESEAHEFRRALLESDDRGAVGGRTKEFWRKACERPLYLAPDDADSARGVEWLRERVG